LRIFGFGENFDPALEARPIEWSRIRTIEAFEEHKWIEASETIEDAILVPLPRHLVAIKLELQLMTKKNLIGTSKVVVEVPDAKSRDMAKK
jgi:hypothetical protein